MRFILSHWRGKWVNDYLPARIRNMLTMSSVTLLFFNHSYAKVILAPLDVMTPALYGKLNFFSILSGLQLLWGIYWFSAWESCIVDPTIPKVGICKCSLFPNLLWRSKRSNRTFWVVELILISAISVDIQHSFKMKKYENRKKDFNSWSYTLKLWHIWQVDTVRAWMLSM